MGSELSQSQEVRNVFPPSEYKILQSEKSYPDLTIFQKVSDSSNIALLVSDNSQNQGKNCSSDHVLKIIDRKKIGKSNLQIYEWANTHVYGLVEYITYIDKTRSITKSQFCAILQGAVKGYSALSEQISPNDCLHIDMRNLRIFHSISVKNDSQNRKQIVDYLHVKVIPLKISKNFKGDSNRLSSWSKIGSCIHKGGVHTQKQLLGHYMLQLSEYISKSTSKDIKEGLKNISNLFCSKISKVIQGLLGNQPWKKIIEILDASENQEIVSLKLDSKEQISSCLSKSKESISTNRIQTNKQISIQKIQSEKNLFRCFEKQTGQNKITINKVTSPPRFTQPIKSERILNEKNMNVNHQEKGKFHQVENNSKINNQPLFSIPKSPQSKKVIPDNVSKKEQNKQPIKPSSVQVIKEIVSDQKSRIKQNDFSPRLTRAKSILTIYPDVFRNQPESRSRIISTKILQNHLRSPQNIQQKVQNFNSPSKSNTSQVILKETTSPVKIKPPLIQKGKGKPIMFQISQINPTLQPIQFPTYEVKTKPDINNNCQKLTQQKTNNSNLRIR